jgi:hypothetical protein
MGYNYSAMVKTREISFGYYYERPRVEGREPIRRVIVDIGDTDSPDFHAVPVINVRGKLHISPLPGTETRAQIGRRVGKLTLPQVMLGIERHSGRGLAESIKANISELSKKGRRKV